jgi:hypothetical protein
MEHKFTELLSFKMLMNFVWMYKFVYAFHLMMVNCGGNM